MLYNNDYQQDYYNSYYNYYGNYNQGVSGIGPISPGYGFESYNGYGFGGLQDIKNSYQDNIQSSYPTSFTTDRVTYKDNSIDYMKPLYNDTFTYKDSSIDYMKPLYKDTFTYKDSSIDYMKPIYESKPDPMMKYLEEERERTQRLEVQRFSKQFGL